MRAHIPLCMLVVLAGPAACYSWPSIKEYQYDSLVFDDNPPFQLGYRAGFLSMSSAVSTCGALPSMGRTFAAGWLRFAYHDVATHSVTDGTGGLDGSLRFDAELGRPENTGVGNLHPPGFFDALINKYISFADVEAYSVVVVGAACGGLKIPFRGGRIDATAPGPFGVPVPEESLAIHTSKFALQGFNQTEMIGLVACGHSLGGVHANDYPLIVSPGQRGVALFHDTYLFDNTIATQYLDGTTKNPLVIGPNATMNSDQRIFSSDGNVTMRYLASSPAAYKATCETLFTKMINTVPKGVNLTDPITPIPFKVLEPRLALLLNGELSLSLVIRMWEAQANDKRTITLRWADRSSTECSSENCQSLSTDARGILVRSLVAGSTSLWYRFNATIDATTSISKFWFEIDEHDGSQLTIQDNGGAGYEMQDRILLVPLRSRIAPSFVNESANWTVAVAVRATTTPLTALSLELKIRKNTPEYLAVNISTANPTISSSQLYSLHTVEFSAATLTSFDIHAAFENGETISDLFRSHEGFFWAYGRSTVWSHLFALLVKLVRAVSSYFFWN